MILVILVIGILMVALGTVLYDKLDCGKDEIGTIFQIVGTVATIISTIVAIVLLICVLNRVNIDNMMTLKFRNMDTGEIIEIDMFDSEAFDECMSHENYQLIFD